MSYVADTSVWIDYLRGVDSRQANYLDASLISRRVIVPDLVLLEVLRGVDSQTTAVRVAAILDNLEFAQIGGREIAGRAADNFRALRAKGITIRGTIDLMIGTWCIINGTPLLHNDRYFDMMEQHLGLERVSVESFQ